METNDRTRAHHTRVYNHTPACLEGVGYCDMILLSPNPGHSFGANNWFDFGSPHENKP